MIVVLLIVIICILLFGGTAVLGVIGGLLGGIVAVAIIAYFGVHYKIDHDLMFPAIMGVCVVGAFATFYFKIRDHSEKQKLEAKELLARADRWEQIVANSGYDNLTPENYELYLTQYPSYREFYDAWREVRRKEASLAG